jgi:acyl-CoA reductase-like NAD-dependent aldehyde dehydrogenase
VVDEFMAKFLELAASIKLGDPKDMTTEMGPLTSTMHRDRVLKYIEIATSEGGEILLGGKQPTDPALAQGCYIEPTIVRA